MIGKALGPYQVVAKLGEGGMGEVYRARDTKLDRDVALKILPASFASDPDRLMRFEREAKTLAALNHPNIAAIYGIEESDGVRALVMELVEGEDLSAHIARGPIAVADALPIARQIADALEAAHEQGIIHRDLKPANIKVRDDGTVKVLDFGLAKALDPMGATSSPDAMNSPTMTSPALTAMGLILGTAAYMAPEQAKGRPVDKRADIWAFGVVLHEMLTGRRVFAAEDVSDTLAAVLTREIDFAALPQATPRPIAALIRRCLQRAPKNRLHDIADARIVLDEVIAGEANDLAGPAPAIPDAPVPSRSGRLLPWTIAAAALLALAAWAAVARPWASPPPAPVMRVQALAGLSGGPPRDLRPTLAIAPDGRTLVFVAAGAESAEGGTGVQRLFVRRLDQLTATPLAGTEDGSGPFFSPDGEWVGFFAKGKLLKIPINGGAAVPLADAPVFRGGAWGEDGVITFSPFAGTGGGLMRVPEGGGSPTPLGKFIEGHVTQRWPQVLPGGRAILYTGFTTVDTFEDACLVVQSLDGSAPRVIQCGGYFWTYVPTGHVLYVHGGTLFAAPFDPTKLAVTGTGVPIVEDVASSAVSGVAQFAVSAGGLLAYFPDDESWGAIDAPFDIVGRTGQVEQVSGKPVNWLSVDYAPDGHRMTADIVSEGRRDAWVFDLDRDAGMRLTFEGAMNGWPIWTPDGRRITFSKSQGGSPNLWWKLSDGSGAEERLAESPLTQVAGSWSPDGRHLAFMQGDGVGAQDIWILPMEEKAGGGLTPGKPEPLLATAANEAEPTFSPDGKWLAYVSNESSASQVYVRAVEGPPGKWQVSVDGGVHPVWSRRAPELLFSDGNQVLFVTYDTADGTFRPSRPARWTPTRILDRAGVRPFALHPDGRRLLTSTQVARTAGTPSPSVVLVTNFFDELRTKVPAR